jgi:hypothetical protein
MSVSPYLEIHAVTFAHIESNKLSMTMRMRDSNVENVKTQGLIDSGAGGKFIDQNYARKAGFKILPLSQPLKALNVDGTENKQGTIRGYVNLQMEINDRRFPIRLLVTGLGKERIILGLPWLHEQNPDINWKTREFSWREPPKLQFFGSNVRILRFIEPSVKSLTLKKRSTPQEEEERQDSDSDSDMTDPVNEELKPQKEEEPDQNALETEAVKDNLNPAGGNLPSITNPKTSAIKIPDEDKRMNCMLNPINEEEGSLIAVIIEDIENDSEPVWINVKTTASVEFHAKYDKKKADL